MGLLDKLRPQPRWKHADPAVRLEGLRELDEPVEVAILAETDPDPRIRRAAVARTVDAATLGRIASADTDEEARDRAADRLLALATSGDEDLGPALEATRLLSDPRRLSLIAKGDAPEPVRTEALARTADERSLGAIARHAKHESTASAALARLTDAAELMDAAQNADHKDVALRAFDRAVSLAPAGPDLAVLKTIEARAQQKAVAKRARTLIQEIEDAETARRQAEETRVRQQTTIVESMERLAEGTDAARLHAERSRLSDGWQALASTDPAMTARFDRATEATQAAIARLEREAEAAAEHARLRAEALATREALCVRVETLDGDEILEHLIPVEEEWRSLAPLVGNGPEADRLAERFAKAVAACRKRHDLGAVLAETRARFEALVVEAEGLPSRTDLAAAAARWQALSREARGLAETLTGASRPVADLADRLGGVERALEARDADRRAAELRARDEFVTKAQRLADRAKRAAEAEAITLREGERLMRDIGAGLDEIAKADIKDSKELDDAARALRALQELVAPRVRELRELDDWRRFANGQQQEQLIAMAEAIVASLKGDEEAGKTSDLAATARALKELHARWGDVAEAPRHSAQRLWDRFRTATDFIRTRCEGFFAKMREERGSNLQRKNALVEEAEKLAQSTDWGKATARLQELQTEWQQVGPTPRDAARDLAQRFRTACNLFFSRRREDLTTRKKAWADSLARKEALCVRAEALADSMDWDAASAEMKRLQADWKTIGPVRRSQSEAIWNRFRAAADRFFERFHNRHQITVMSKIAERETMVVELETLVAAEDAPADLADRIQQLRATWYRSVPIAAAEMTPLANRWQTAFATAVSRWPEAFKGTDLDPVAIRQKMEKLVSRVESLLGDVREQPEGRSQAEILAAKLRSALASNAMGGRASEESKWRAAADGVKDAQAAWQRLAPLTGPEAQDLDMRFREACRRVNDQARRHTVSAKRPVKQTAAAAV